MSLKTKIAAAIIFAAASLADAATTVAVIELGKGGVVRRTSSRTSRTTVQGVSSFWSSLHTSTGKLQDAGMTVVPDLFKRAEGGLVLALTGNIVHLNKMPAVREFVEKEGHQGVVGHMKIPGEYGQALLARVGPTATEIDVASLRSIKAQSGFHALSLKVNESDVAKVDSAVAGLVQSLHKEATDADVTIVLHLVVEEEGGFPGRRLEDQEADEEAEEEGDQDAADADKNQNAYYGYGYYNDNGEWVTPYKTMFQIQHFNIVLWTSIGLIALLIFTVQLMINMPLMADTLLFGESAKMMGE